MKVLVAFQLMDLKSLRCTWLKMKPDKRKKTSTPNHPISSTAARLGKPVARERIPLEWASTTQTAATPRTPVRAGSCVARDVGWFVTGPSGGVRQSEHRAVVGP